MIQRPVGNRNTIGSSLIYLVQRIMHSGSKASASEHNVQLDAQFSILSLNCD
jgi:hypothetical protein